MRQNGFLVLGNKIGAAEQLDNSKDFGLSKRGHSSASDSFQSNILFGGRH